MANMPKNTDEDPSAIDDGNKTEEQEAKEDDERLEEEESSVQLPDLTPEKTYGPAEAGDEVNEGSGEQSGVDLLGLGVGVGGDADDKNMQDSGSEDDAGGDSDSEEEDIPEPSAAQEYGGYQGATSTEDDDGSASGYQGTSGYQSVEEEDANADQDPHRQQIDKADIGDGKPTNGSKSVKPGEDDGEGAMYTDGSVHQWTYKSGGDFWEGRCKTGLRQSPINIDTKALNSSSATSSSAQMEFRFCPQSGLTIDNNGHSIAVGADFGLVLTGDANRTESESCGCCCPCKCKTRYMAMSLAFHSPAEHTVDGRTADMEMHIVFRKDGSKGKRDLIITAVQFDAINSAPTSGAGERFLDNLGFSLSKKGNASVTNLPTKKGDKRKIRSCLDLSPLVDAALGGAFYLYDGSLTSPTCEETVSWRLMQKRLTMTKEQLAAVQQVFSGNKEFAHGHGNNRHVQSRHGRSIVSVPASYSSGSGSCGKPANTCGESSCPCRKASTCSAAPRCTVETQIKALPQQSQQQGVTILKPVHE